MDSIDKAIRNALAKGDASDQAFREKVYRSAFTALDKATASNDAVEPQMADRRRKALADRIRLIENEFADAQANPLEEAGIEAESGDEAGGTPDRFSRNAPEIELEEPAAQYRPPSKETTEETDGGTIVVGERESRSEIMASPRRRPIMWFFVLALMAATVGMAIWWTRESGILLSSAERDTSVPNPPETLSSEDYRPENAELPMSQNEGQHRSWINIFSPDNPTTVSTGAGAVAEISGEGKDKVLRIRSGSADSAVIFDVGPGILGQLAGKRVIFDIVASSEENKPTEISVRCEFGKLGNCIRKRYNVGLTTAEYLFEIALADASPDKAGSIAIVSDVNGTGLAVDIREIRVAVEK